jgi:crotonobetainyl-CoA:carnitine CoA-transferase CaiB-like acyl-CoA transferase
MEPQAPRRRLEPGGRQGVAMVDRAHRPRHRGSRFRDDARGIGMEKTASGSDAAHKGQGESLPLAGLKVLDISTYIAAPAAAVVLSDFGADVIKIEQPGEGDPNRALFHAASYPKQPSYPATQVNYPWNMDARNKRSLAIDLKASEGRAVLDKLIAAADILIINFPHPVRARLKLAYDDVAHLNPRLIYASLTGYGEEGPDRDQPGFDSTAYFARSGLCDQMRYEGQPPHFSLPAQGDRATAMGLLSGILLALYDRERTGKGTMVSTSLLANGLWSNGVYAQAALTGGTLPLRPPRSNPRSALGNLYRTKDDRWILLAIPVEDRMWPRLCEALRIPGLETDPRFAEIETRRANAEPLTRIFDGVFATRDIAEWRQRLKTVNVPFSQIARIEDIATDEQARASGAVIETGDPEMPLTIAPPFRLKGAAMRKPAPGPALGADTDTVLAEVGLTAAEIRALRKGGVVG